LCCCAYQVVFITYGCWSRAGVKSCVSPGFVMSASRMAVDSKYPLEGNGVLGTCLSNTVSKVVLLPYVLQMFVFPKPIDSRAEALVHEIADFLSGGYSEQVSLRCQAVTVKDIIIRIVQLAPWPAIRSCTYIYIYMTSGQALVRARSTVESRMQ
jgi:hypothetical protein